MPACQKATMHANLLDKVQINVDYQHIPTSLKNVVQKLYSFARYAGYAYVSEDYYYAGKQGRIEVEGRLAPNMQSANVTIKTPALQAQFENIRLNKMETIALGVHPSMSLKERFERRLLQNSHVCVVDHNLMNTFDNYTMEHSFGKCWHVMMQTAKPSSADPTSHSDETNQDEQVSVSVRDIDNNKKELMILLGQENGHDYTPIKPYKMERCNKLHQMM